MARLSWPGKAARRDERLAEFDAEWIVDVKQDDGDAADRRAADEVSPLPSEMRRPFLASGIEKGRELVGLRVQAGQVRAFVRIARIAADLGIPEGRIHVTTPRKPFELGGVKVSAVRAIHGNPKTAVHCGAKLEDCGHPIELGGKTFLQPGDSPRGISASVRGGFRNSSVWAR